MQHYTVQDIEVCHTKLVPFPPTPNIVLLDRYLIKSVPQDHVYI